jgi:aryl-alcohol dehydrogenase-like predicted oxidoreductase
VLGPPKDRQAALAVLREAIARGVNHIDTSDYYGPHVTNQLIREALHPYPDDLVIVTKVGAVRGADASWISALTPADLTRAFHDNQGVLGFVFPGMCALSPTRCSSPAPGLRRVRVD